MSWQDCNIRIQKLLLKTELEIEYELNAFPENRILSQFGLGEQLDPELKCFPPKLDMESGVYILKIGRNNNLYDTNKIWTVVEDKWTQGR
jgi:hypothetical protein